MPSVPNSCLCPLIWRPDRDDKRKPAETRCLVGSRCSDFLNDDRDSNRGGLLDLHQRVGNVNVGAEYGTATSSGGINWIGDRCVDPLHMSPRAGNHDSGRIGIDLNDLLPFRENSGYSGVNFHLPGKANIKCQVKLAGNNLFDLDLPRVANLLGGKLKGPLPGRRTSQIDFGLHIVGAQPANDALRTTNPDLRFGNGLGADFEISRHIVKYNGGPNRNFGGLFVAGNQEP